MNGAQYTYDAAGDVTWDGLNNYLYDAEGRLCAVRNSWGAMTGYIYDASGIRVARGSLSSFSCNFSSNGFQTTTSWVLGPGGEQVTEYSVSVGASTWVHTNAYASGALLATYHDTDTYFALEDWLGTKRVEVSAGGCFSWFTSMPYGNGLTPGGNCADATEHHFTGKERDTESGNDYFGARYYASTMGRFMSPDWSAREEPVPYATLDDPQTLNLYSYVRNNPLSGVDADGHAFGVDDLIGALAGGAVGAGVEVVKDLATGEKITAGGVIGAAVGGAIVGEGVVNIPETLGGSAVAAAALKGAAQGAVSNLVQQGVDNATGDQKGFSGKSLAISTGLGAVTGGLASKVPDLKIPGISSGKGNMKAVAEGVSTRIANGTASNMSLKTALKGAIGGQVADAGKTATDAAANAAANKACNAATSGGCK